MLIQTLLEYGTATAARRSSPFTRTMVAGLESETAGLKSVALTTEPRPIFRERKQNHNDNTCLTAILQDNLSKSVPE